MDNTQLKKELSTKARIIRDILETNPEARKDIGELHIAYYSKIFDLDNMSAKAFIRAVLGNYAKDKFFSTDRARITVQKIFPELSEKQSAKARKEKQQAIEDYFNTVESGHVFNLFEYLEHNPVK